MEIVENISSLQKIALVTGLPYDLSLDKSLNYPFALFFSGGDPEINDPMPPSIIKNGVRFTRFIDVNPNQKEVQINDHIVVINFDYQKGYLSIGDKYKLNDIELIELSYISISSNSTVPEVQWTNYGGGNFNIDSKDNKFSLKVKFTAEDGDIRQIPKTLSFIPYNEYVQYLGYGNSPEDESIGIYYFKVLDTKNDPLYLQAISSYSTNKTIDNIIFQTIRLNPTYFYVYDIQPYGVTQVDNKYKIKMGYNETRDIKVSLFCDIFNASFENLKIKVYPNPYDPNNEYIDIVDVNGNNDIKYGVDIEKDIYFKLIGQDTIPNVLTTTSFIIEVIRTDLGDNGKTILSNTFNVELTGEVIDNYWYIGDEYPNDNNVRNTLNNIGSIQNYEVSEIQYFAISEKYKDIIYPRNNFYDNFKGEYCDARNWFDYENPIIEVIHGINMYIYTYNTTELGNTFYGKIQ